MNSHYIVITVCSYYIYMYVLYSIYIVYSYYIVMVLLLLYIFIILYISVYPMGHPFTGVGSHGPPTLDTIGPVCIVHISLGTMVVGVMDP